MAISFTWFHNNSNGSILAAIIFHIAINFAGIAIPVTSSPDIPSYLNYAAFDIVILVLKVIIIIAFGAKTLVRGVHKGKKVHVGES